MSGASLLARFPALVPEPARQRNHVAWVLLVSEEQASLAERCPSESQCQHFTELVHQEHLDLISHFLGQIFQVGLVLLRKNDLGDSGPNCAENLLLYSADGH